MTTTTKDGERIHEMVRARYAGAALEVMEEQAGGCCEPVGEDACCGTAEPLEPERAQALYSTLELEAIPSAASLASLGCGNPVAVAELHEGETVLDLGSGGGIDVLLSARRVGPAGHAYGLDMTCLLYTSDAADDTSEV